MKSLDIFKLRCGFTKVYEKVVALDLNTTKNIYLTECASNLSKYIASKLFEDLGENIVYVTSSIYEASKAYEVICDIAGTDNVSFFPVEEFISSELVASSDAFRLARMQTINQIIKKKPQIIVTNVEGITRKMMTLDKLKDAILEYKKGSIVNRDQLIQNLVIRGYKKVALTTTSGTFSVRGSLIDVFPINYSNPIRINFFDDEIENLKEIDVETQMSVKTLEMAQIYPLYEVFYEASQIDEIKNKILKENKVNDKILKDIEDISNYQNLEQLYSYMPYLCENTVEFIKLLDMPICFYENYQASLEHEKATLEEISNYYLNYQRIKQKDLFTNLIDIMYDAKLNIYTSLFRSSLNDRSLDMVEPLYTTNTFEYNNNMKAFISDIKANKDRTYLISHMDEKKLSFLEEVFSSHDIEFVKIDDISELQKHKVNLTVLKDSYGFEELNDNFAFVTPNEFAPGKIVKSSKYQKFLKESVKIYNKEELSPGDFVVHQDYGIGKYIGIKTKELRNVVNDYLCIEYSGDSKLYVPVENIYVLEKYLGSTDKKPKLNSLNSKEWQKKKERIKEKTKEIAKQLIKVQAIRDAKKGFVYKEDSIEQLEFESDFEYKETIDQKRAIEEVKRDMESSRPLDRLICGDVGFGKTEIAMRAAFKAVDNGKQVVYLAPTTILTRQHYYSFKERFEKYGIRVELLNRFVPDAKQKIVFDGLKKGYVDIVIGTHRVLSKDIVFKDLGLLIIDEEQRFGVEQKERIKNMKEMVDVLTLSATPIPRTLQMALSGLRELSLIETAPNNRLPIQTYILESNDSVIREAINREMGRGGQVFYLLNRISELDSIRRKIHKLVPHAKIGLIHGKMAKEEIEDELILFLDKKYNILICTTIIETGIDIPNANTLIIERADTLGLSQLYQIRGRVGRSDRIAYAYLMYDKSKVITQNATKRLETMREFTELGSGYKIAMRDLAIRGSGDILGSEQSGYIDAVGMDLYMKLLNEAIQEEKGLAKEEEKKRLYNLDVSRHVEEDYVSDDSIRIEIHKSINKITSRDQIKALTEEFTDRYGKLSDDIMIYMEAKYLEYLLKVNGVEKFQELSNMVSFNFDEEATSKINARKIFEISVLLKLKYKFDYRNKKIVVSFSKPVNSKNYIYSLNKFLEKVYEIKVK